MAENALMRRKHMRMLYQPAEGYANERSPIDRIMREARAMGYTGNNIEDAIAIIFEGNDEYSTDGGGEQIQDFSRYTNTRPPWARMDRRR